jgi:hypothetical protein
VCRIGWEVDVDWHLVVDLLAACGTLFLGAAAIWGDWLRARWAPPKLELCLLPNAIGTEVKTTAAGQEARYYHLKAVNRSPLTLKDCRVVLCGLRKREADGSWTEIPFPVPFPLIWSGDEHGPELVSVTTDRVFDFGTLQVGKRDMFWPRLRYWPVAFEEYGVVRRGGATQYDVKVDARNYWVAKPQTFQVSWDGEFPLLSQLNWSSNPGNDRPMNVQPSEGVKTRAQIDTEVARGLMLANGGGAVALLAFLPVVFDKGLLRPLALPVLCALFTFHLGVVAALIHSHYRRRCSLTYEAHGFRPPPGKLLWFALREPTECWASWKWMWVSIVFFLAAGCTVFIGTLLTVLCR